MISPTARIQYLTRKLEAGTATPSERDELAILVGHSPAEFQGPDDTLVLLAIALTAIAAGVLIAYLVSRR